MSVLPPIPEAAELGEAAHQGRIGDYLALVAEMSRAFAGSYDIRATVKLALQRITDYLDAEAGSVFLHDASGALLICHACVGPVDITGLEILASQGIVGKSARENRTLIVRDTANDPDFAGQVDAKTGFVTRSILCAPLSVGDEVLGCIELINKRRGALFDGRDRSVLEALAAAAAMALFNARQASALVDRQKLERELELAQEIQRGLLPKAASADAPVHGFNLPARTVSGDFFDHVTQPDGRIGFILADVAGKGMNAALLMAKTAALFHLLAKQDRSPSAIAALVNDEIEETATHGMFVTAVIGRHDPATGETELANAGHEPGLIVAGDGFSRTVEAAAPPLGIMRVDGDVNAFPSETVNLRDGALYLFTDGLTEGRINDGSRFERARVDALIKAVHHLPAPDRLAALAGPLTRPAGPLHDDITALVVDGRVWPLLHRGKVPGEPRSLIRIRNTLRAVLQDLECPEPLAHDLVLAVDEACQNIIRHGYLGGDANRDIELVIRGDKTWLEVDLLDRAPQIDPELICPRDLSEVRPGGLGVNFICDIMDGVSFLSRPDGGMGNLLRLSQRLT